MKNKLLALLASVGLTASASAVDVNDNLKIQGFLDFSYYNAEAENGANRLDTQELEMDEVEIDFLFNVGDVTGEIHVDNDGSGDESFDIEQSHFTYSLDNGVSFTFGRFGSALGFEREDPAGLYTFSRAYGDVNGTTFGSGARAQSFNFGNVDANVFTVLMCYTLQTHLQSVHLLLILTMQDNLKILSKQTILTLSFQLPTQVLKM